jgi:alkaline phosphatase
MRLGRRAFLKGGGLWLGSWQGISAAAEAVPLVRFGLITDVHHADKPERGTRYYRESLSKLREGLSQFRSAKAHFAVELGDLVDAADAVDTERAWLREAVREFRSIDVDTHYVLGNHCVQTLTKGQFLADIGKERSCYSFDRGAIRFVVLDACYRSDGVSYDEGNFDWKDTDIPVSQRVWLKEQLALAPGKAVVFVHQRLDVPGVHTVASAGEVRRILSDSGKVLAVFQGHSHQNDYHEAGGIHYCTMRAVVEGSGPESSGYGIVSIFDGGRLHIQGFRAQRPYALSA